MRLSLTQMGWLILGLMLWASSLHFSDRAEGALEIVATLKADGEGNSFKQALWLALLVPTLAVLAARGGRLMQTGWCGALSLVFAGVVLIHIPLSEDPPFTLRRSAAFLIYCLSAVAFALIPRTPAEAHRLLRGASTFIAWTLAASLAVWVVWPSWAVPDAQAGRLAGIWSGPVILGKVSAFVLLLPIAHRAAGLPWRDVRRLAWASGTGAVACLLLSQTRSSVVGVLVGLCSTLLFLRASNRVFIFVLTATAIVLALLLQDAVFALLREVLGVWRHDTARSIDTEILTLTGRTRLWEGMMSVGQMGLTGAGFRTFWRGDRVLLIAAIAEFVVTGAHNTWLEVLFDLGLLGLASALAMVFAFARAFARASGSTDDDARFIGRYGVIFGCMLLSQTMFTQLINNVTPFFWFFLVCGFLARRFGHASAPASAPDPEPQPTPAQLSPSLASPQGLSPETAPAIAPATGLGG